MKDSFVSITGALLDNRMGHIESKYPTIKMEGIIRNDDSEKQLIEAFENRLPSGGLRLLIQSEQLLKQSRCIASDIRGPEFKMSAKTFEKINEYIDMINMGSEVLEVIAGLQ